MNQTNKIKLQTITNINFIILFIVYNLRFPERFIIRFRKENIRKRILGKTEK